MRKILSKKIFLSVAMPSFIVAVFIYSNSTSVDYSYSTIDILTEVKDNNTHQATNILLASEFKDTNTSTNKFNVSELEILTEKLSIDHIELSELIVTLEKEHEEIMLRMREQGIEIGRIDKMSPRLKVVISTFLQLSPSSLTLHELKESRLSSTDWYYLSLLANSSDFIILLKNEELSSNFLQIQNIKPTVRS
jgi:hypothetical protein